MKPREQREEREGQRARDKRQSATQRHATEEETDLTGETGKDRETQDKMAYICHRNKTKT